MEIVCVAHSVQPFASSGYSCQTVEVSDVFESKPGDTSSSNRNRHVRVRALINELPLDQFMQDSLNFRSTVGIEVTGEFIVRLGTMLSLIHISEPTRLL